MLNKFNTNNNSSQVSCFKNSEIDFNNPLVDISSSGKERDWRGKKIKNLELCESYKRLGILEKAERVSFCATNLAFRILEESKKKLIGAFFCKVRLCPTCSWRRSLKIFSQVSKIMNEVVKNYNYKFLFLTLTIKNINSNELSDAIDEILKAFNLLTKRKEFKLAIKGWFRGLEITHNTNIKSKSYNTYHPHVHVVLAVNKSYFKDSKIYMNQEQWTKIWKSCLKSIYVPIVNIKVFKSSGNKEISKSIAEVCKYSVKDNDYLILEDEILTDSTVLTLDNALHKRRLVAFGGLFKELHKKLNLDNPEDGDLILIDEDEEVNEDLAYVIEKYQWFNGFNQYYKIKMDELVN